MLGAGREGATPFSVLLGVSAKGPSLGLSRDREGPRVEGEGRCPSGLEAVCGRLTTVCPGPLRFLARCP